jgi:hypothetical protein
MTQMPPPVPVPPEPTVDDRKRVRIIRNAKQNCIAMFVIFALLVVVSIVMIAAVLTRGQSGVTATSASPESSRFGCIGTAAIAGGIFALIYLPFRWRIIKELSPTVKALGLIGGFGLIAFLLLATLGLVLGFSGAGH